MSVMNCIEAEEGVAEYMLEKADRREKAREFAREFWEETDRINAEKKAAEERRKKQERLNKACSDIENFVSLYFNDNIDLGNNFIYEVINGRMPLRQAIVKYNISLFNDNISELDAAFYVCMANRHMPYIKSRKDMLRLDFRR